MNRQADLKIVPFAQQYSREFADLNYEWLNRYFVVEEHDREMLEDPMGYIIAPGGHIFMALADGKAVGTVALIYMEADGYELAKMAVTPAYRGLKIGQQLMEHAIAHARSEGKKRLMLESNTSLDAALTITCRSQR